MDNVGMLPPEMWARYKAACRKLLPKLDTLKGIFADIAAGKHDTFGTAYTEQCVECDVEGIREELNRAIYPERYPSLVSGDDVL